MRGHKKVTAKRPPTDMPTTRVTRLKKNSTVQRDDTSIEFSIGSAAPSGQVEQISTNFDNHNLTEG
jgi:hypothetical protein